MALTVLALVLTSALLHAAWNAMLKRSREPEVAVLAMIAIGAASAVGVALALRVPFPPRASVVWSIGAGVLEAGYLITLARALSRAPFGAVYTIARGGALLVVWPISIALLGEALTAPRAAGTVLVLAGLAATSWKTRPASERASERSGLAWAAVCAVFIGAYHLAYKLALTEGGNAPAADAISLSTAATLNLSIAGPAKLRAAVRALRAEPGRILTGGVFANLSFLLFLFAMAQGGAGVLLTLRNTSILFALGFAFALGERPGRLGLVGVALVFAGAVLLAL
ncbi:MAG: EamA family transporter [Polyangiaceae bacterium]|jgi:drug/metabolite transporter (DMT)-like permease|nr:EamA family transporter [Polyangiaceae bacterium]MBK8939638.1 EamA family transporter [Polyangiaceae bacterium]